MRPDKKRQTEKQAAYDDRDVSRFIGAHTAHVSLPTLRSPLAPMSTSTTAVASGLVDRLTAAFPDWLLAAVPLGAAVGALPAALVLASSSGGGGGAPPPALLHVARAALVLGLAAYALTRAMLPSVGPYLLKVSPNLNSLRSKSLCASDARPAGPHPHFATTRTQSAYDDTPSHTLRRRRRARARLRLGQPLGQGPRRARHAPRRQPRDRGGGARAGDRAARVPHLRAGRRDGSRFFKPSWGFLFAPLSIATTGGFARAARPPLSSRRNLRRVSAHQAHEAATGTLFGGGGDGDSAGLVMYNSALLAICFMVLLGFMDDVLDLPWRVH